MANYKPPTADPTPQEIRERCEAIRRTWPAKRLEANELREAPRVHRAKEADLQVDPGHVR